VLGIAKYSASSKLSTEKLLRNSTSASIVQYVTPAVRDAEWPVRDRKFNIELLFKALADPTRLRLIQLLGDREVCVCSFVEALQTNQPKVSRHLAYLRRAGLVVGRRDGKWTHYRLVEPTDPQAAKIFRELRVWLASKG
jgi:DNA-binding transcriptional ArsR family regulator